METTLALPALLAIHHLRATCFAGECPQEEHQLAAEPSSGHHEPTAAARASTPYQAVPGMSDGTQSQSPEVPKRDLELAGGRAAHGESRSEEQAQGLRTKPSASGQPESGSLGTRMFAKPSAGSGGDHASESRLQGLRKGLLLGCSPALLAMLQHGNPH